jgi:hypothetical protein
MKTTENIHSGAAALDLLSALMFRETDLDDVLAQFALLDRNGRKRLQQIADANHVTVRALSRLALKSAQGGQQELAAWAASVVLEEQSRIERTVKRLCDVCQSLEERSIDLTIIKTFDHWPDFGRDIDGFTRTPADRLKEVMVEGLNAQLLDRSWGDRLAGKYSFTVPGLGKTLEIHIGRLGQVGEQCSIGKTIHDSRQRLVIDKSVFYVPSTEVQVIAATLQRMYRHFFFRISDIVNTDRLLSEERLDLYSLKETATACGIWEGVSEFLNLVTRYASFYRSSKTLWPVNNGELGLTARGKFLRLPIFPRGAMLYSRELMNLLGTGQLASGFRLTLLPPLAFAAGISFKLTGSNQGIW